jgi:hypothetical protein
MTSTQSLTSLVYLSAATCPFSPLDLNELLARSRENNTVLGVTGMLLFKDGNFLQVLEGRKETVFALYEKIGRDPRHRNLTALSQGPITKPDFPDWSMGFHNLGSAAFSRPQGFTPFLETTLTMADFAADPGRAKKMLLLFKDEKLLVKASSAR